MSVASPVIDYIDPVPRKIYLLVGITEYHPVEDIYTEVRNLRRLTLSLRGHDIFVTAGGSLPKNLAGTKRTPRYAIFHDCQVVLSGDVFISGEQLFADSNGDLVGSGKDCVDRVLSPADAYAEYAPPNAEVIKVTSGSGLDAAQDAKLTRIHALEEADEIHNPTSIVKKAKGTETVLLTKDVTGSNLTAELTVIEAP